MNILVQRSEMELMRLLNTYLGKRSVFGNARNNFKLNIEVQCLYAFSYWTAAEQLTLTFGISTYFTVF